MDMHKKKILIVDDSTMNRDMLSSILEDRCSIMEAKNGLEAISVLQEYGHMIDLVLLDIVMPDMDGFAVLSVMNRNHWIQDIPVIMISSENSPNSVERAFQLGVADFIARPFDAFIVRQRVQNTLSLYGRQRRLIDLATNQLFEKERSTNLLINILSYIVEFRNGESGLHVLHVQLVTQILLRHLAVLAPQYNLTSQDITRISTASALHDIGKIAIDDRILNKPGKLTDEEYAIMKTHSAIGADMLKRLTMFESEPLVKTAYEICRWHHERYDGKGYPDGLKGDEIPISAQAVAIADVYDALTSDRCYHKARSHEESIAMIYNNECGVFHPLLLQCLADSAEEIRKETAASMPNLHPDRDMKKVTAALMEHQDLSASEQVFQSFQLERQRTHFFSSINHLIQFDFTATPPLLTFNTEGIRQLSLASSTFDPYTSEELHRAISSEDLQAINKIMQTISPENSDQTYTCVLHLHAQPEQEYTLWFRGLWTADEPPKRIGFVGQVMQK